MKYFRLVNTPPTFELEETKINKPNLCKMRQQRKSETNIFDLDLNQQSHCLRKFGAVHGEFLAIIRLNRINSNYVLNNNIQSGPRN